MLDRTEYIPGVFFPVIHNVPLEWTYNSDVACFLLPLLISVFQVKLPATVLILVHIPQAIPPGVPFPEIAKRCGSHWMTSFCWSTSEEYERLAGTSASIVSKTLEWGNSPAVSNWNGYHQVSFLYNGLIYISEWVDNLVYGSDAAASELGLTAYARVLSPDGYLSTVVFSTFPAY